MWRRRVEISVPRSTVCRDLHCAWPHHAHFSRFFASAARPSISFAGSNALDENKRPFLAELGRG